MEELFNLIVSFVSVPLALQDSERAAVVAAEERSRRLESQLQEEKALSLSAHHVRTLVNFLSQSKNFSLLNLVPLYLLGTVFLL